MDLASLNTSEKISALAFAVSVSGFIVNHWYTRKKFRQTSDPEIFITPRIISDPFGSVECEIENLSSSVAIRDLQVVAFIRKHPAGLLHRRWVQFGEKATNPVQPHEKTKGPSLHLGSVSRAIVKHFPGYLEEISMEIQNITAGRVSPKYRILKDQKWEIKLVVTYRGAVPGARNLKQNVRLITESNNKIHHYSIKLDGLTEKEQLAIVGGWDTIT